MKKKYLTVLAAGSMLLVAQAASVVGNVALEQDAATRTVKITYDLSGDPAIITFDILTNAVVAAQGASIGDAHLTYSRGDVNRLVQPGEHKTIWWQADRAWPDHEIDTASVRPSVTAWPTNSPPLYLVVNLLANQEDQVRYYVSSNAIPGGLLESPTYRETHMVLRRIDARNVEWTMVDAAKSDGPHTVTLQNNYYAAVFPVTQGQWYALKGTRNSSGYYLAPRSARRPVHVSYNQMRESSNSGGNETYRYPKGPNPESIIGIVNARTGLVFDLPSDAQWEYACRSGLAGGVWNNGQATTEDMPGRHRNNGGHKNGSAAPTASDEDWGTPVVGSYEPNKWGLYDMHGSLEEWCLDWYVQDSSTVTGCETGAVNTVAGTKRVTRGGSFNVVPYNCRSVSRSSKSPSDDVFYCGARMFMTLPSTDETPVSVVSSEPYALLASGRKAASSVARNVVFDPNAVGGFSIIFK